MLFPHPSLCKAYADAGSLGGGRRPPRKIRPENGTGGHTCSTPAPCPLLDRLQRTEIFSDEYCQNA